MIPHTGTQLYLLTMSFFLQPTNKQTFRHKADSKLRTPQNLTNTRQYGKTLRLEFTLTKSQEGIQNKRARDKLLLLAKIIKIRRKAARAKDL